MEEEPQEQEEEITTLSQLVIELGSDSDDDDSAASSSSSSSSSQRVAQWLKEAPANFLIEFPDTREQLEFLTRQTDSASVERCVAQLQVIPLTPENVQKETCRAYMLQILKEMLLELTEKNKVEEEASSEMDDSDSNQSLDDSDENKDSGGSADGSAISDDDDDDGGDDSIGGSGSGGSDTSDTSGIEINQKSDVDGIDLCSPSSADVNADELDDSMDDSILNISLDLGPRRRIQVAVPISKSSPERASLNVDAGSTSAAKQSSQESSSRMTSRDGQASSALSLSSIMPMFQNMSDDVLRERMELNGMKSRSRSVMISRLQEIWKMAHSDSQVDLRKENVPAGAKSDDVWDLVSDDDEAASGAAAAENGAGEDEEEEEEERTLESKIFKGIENDKALHLDILQYKVVECSRVQRVVQCSQVNVTKKQIRTFLDSQGISNSFWKSRIGKRK